MSDEKRARPAVSSLGLALQAARWMGQGPAPARSKVAPRRLPGQPAPAVPSAEASPRVPTAAVVPAPAPAAELAIAAETAKDELVPPPQGAPTSSTVEREDLALIAAESSPAPPSDAELPEPQDELVCAQPSPAPAASSPAAAAELPLAVEGDEVSAEIGDRRYVVGGLSRNKSHDLMKVRVKVMRGEAFHVDSLDLYSHRLRQIFQRAVADELELDEDLIKRDLGRLLLALEKVRDAELKKTLEPKKDERVEIPKERKLAALTRLRTAGLVAWIDESLTLCGLVGERVNKLVAYLACVSRLLFRPLAIMVQSSSAAGKSTLMEGVLLLMPPESRVKYSAMTGQALFYMGDTVDLRHKILAIAEEEGASRATYALKLLQSEGELSIVATGKDPQTGELRSKVYELQGPIMPFVPTTAVDPDEEWENRCIRLAVDEGREQTRRIHEMQRQMMTLEGIVAQTKRAKVIELHHDCQRLLRPLAVRIPYAMRLTFPDHATRTRRDHMKYLGLIQAITLLHQHQREVKETAGENGAKVPYIDATLEDMALANELANEVLGRSLSELPAQTQAFLDQLHELVGKACAAKRIERADYRMSRREILDYTGLSLTAVRRYLQRLVEYEYVLVHQGTRGQTFTYELLYNGEARVRERFVMGLVDVGRLKEGGEMPRTTADMAPPEGQLAPPWHPHGTPMAPRWHPPTDAGNGTSPNGSSGSEPRSGENVRGPKPNGEGRRNPPPVVSSGPGGAN